MNIPPETREPNTQIIKVSLAFRARFAVKDESKGESTEVVRHTLAAGLVVPHPSNRGGEPCKSIRTKELTGEIAVVWVRCGGSHWQRGSGAGDAG